MDVFVLMGCIAYEGDYLLRRYISWVYIILERMPSLLVIIILKRAANSIHMRFRLVWLVLVLNGAGKEI